MAAVVDAHEVISSTTTQIIGTTSITAPASGILFVWAWTVLAATPPPHVTAVSLCGGSWNEITHLDSANNSRCGTVGYLTGCTGSGTCTITTDQTMGSDQAYAVAHWTNVNTITPYVSTNTKSNTLTGTSNTVTPNALAQATNDFVVVTGHPTAEDVTKSNGSATELFDDNATSNRGIEMNDFPGWTSGAMGGSWTTSGASIIIGIEVDDSGTPAAGGGPLSPLFHTITGGYRS